jgi:hypothetical protein
MSPSSSQIDQLKREIASGQVVGVVLGSGVSVAACGRQEVGFDPQLRHKLIA